MGFGKSFILTAWKCRCLRGLRYRPCRD